MLFLCGNDFLPPVATLRIEEGALHYFFSLYRNMLERGDLDAYITDSRSGSINWNQLAKFLHVLGDLEIHVLNDRFKRLSRRFHEWRTFHHDSPKENLPLQPAVVT
eukprot:TRINITY_DN8835_c0_g1_i1.p2 TRINITY_DN8835_c0_g1~~TRINITY_DN8835_c0_g1_i1.p2  ORF type:complete len:106 (-),score=23.54 TRINITY_DN8835_c0_g1_i1:292-609(-)